MIFAAKLIFSIAIFIPSIPGLRSSQLFLQPSKTEHGYFTNDSFFVTCFTTDETADHLSWTGNDDNLITAKKGRIHVQNVDPSQSQQGLDLVVESVHKDDSGRYICADTQNSIYFDLIVYKSISFGDTPKKQEAPEGSESARINCHVRADPKPSVTWYFNGSKLTTSDKFTVEDDALVIRDVRRSDAGIYRCKAFVITPLGAQVKELDINFEVQYAPELLDIESSVVYTSFGSEANLTCSASANPEPFFQWLKDVEKIHNSSDHMILSNHNETILRFKVTNSEQFGEYTCSVSNSLGSQEKVIQLREGYAPEAPTLSVNKEVHATLILDLKGAPNSDNELPITGYRVQFVFSTESWDQANSQDFDKGEQYILRNISQNSDYILRASARNAAGYGKYSEGIKYTTHKFEVAPVKGDNSAIGITISSVALLINALMLWLQ